MIKTTPRWWLPTLSVFLLWHSVALLIGPMPSSYLMERVYPIFRPYMQTLHLTNPWGFFAPNPSAGRFIRYSVIDAQGRSHAFPFTEVIPRSDPTYLSLEKMSSVMDKNKPSLLASVAQRLCRQHAALQPVRIEFTRMQLRRLTTEEFERGARALDEARLKPVALPTQDCRP